MQARVVVLCAGIMVIGLWSGCSPQVKSQGANQDITATYSGGTLRSNLPETARVPAIIAAADQTFRSRGYAVMSNSSTEDAGEIVAKAPRHDNYPRVQVRASRGASSTVVDIDVTPFGDQDLSRSVLDGILQALGL